MKYYAHIRQLEDGCVLYQTVQELSLIHISEPTRH